MDKIESVFGQEGSQAVALTSDEIAAASAATAEEMASRETELNKGGFVQAMNTAFGGIIASNTYAIKYPLFLPAIETNDWINVQAIIIDANDTSVLTPTQYAAIKAAAIANNIPIVLP